MRGPPGFSVYDALARVRDVLQSFGGHHAAAGVEVASERLEALRERFSEACADAGVPAAADRSGADAVLHESDSPARVVGDLERFEPCGQSNPAPRIAIARARLLEKRELRGGHLRLWVDVGGAPLSCFGGDMGPLASQLGSHVSLVGRAPARHLAGRGRRRDAPGRRGNGAVINAAGRAILGCVGAGQSGGSDKTAAARPPGETLIRFDGVQKSFGPKVIYSGLSLEIRRGETITVMGRFRAAARASCSRCSSASSTPTPGEILFDGRDVMTMNDRELTDVRRRIAYLFQGAALFDSLNVGENVAYGLREQFWDKMTGEEIEARVEQSLELVGLPGIQSMRPSDLSGGMKKRVGLARTLALQPEVILYDEPTTGLDPINTARINHLILGIQRASQHHERGRHPRHGHRVHACPTASR